MSKLWDDVLMQFSFIVARDGARVGCSVCLMLHGSTEWEGRDKSWKDMSMDQAGTAARGKLRQH